VSGEITQVEVFLRAVLRGEEPPWPGETPQFAENLVTRARAHGVLALLSKFHSRGWPSGLLDHIRSEARASALWEMAHHHEVRTILAALKALGIEPLVIKGTALAYSLYEEPWERTRADTDLVMPAGSADAVESAFAGLGYAKAIAAPSNQTSFVGGPGTQHVFDVHWRYSNSRLLSNLFPYAELRQHARPIPLLHETALAPDPVYSLLIACAHKETHATNPLNVDGVAHHDPRRLCWILDIDLLARSLDPEEWQRLVALAKAKGLARICGAGLADAQRDFATPVPDSVRDGLNVRGRERAAAYLRSGPVRQLWMDLASMPGWSERLASLQDILAPPRSYMRARFGDSHPLALLYFMRAIRGIARRLNTARD
jgi:hypothetical protein